MELLQVWVPESNAGNLPGSWSRRGLPNSALCGLCMSRIGKTVQNAAICARGGIDTTAQIDTVFIGQFEKVHPVPKRVLARMDQQGCVPSVLNYVQMLQECTKTKDLAKARSLYAHICRNRLELNSVIGEMLVSMFVQCGSMVEAVVLFNRLLKRTDLSWTAVISGYSKNKQGHEAIKLYRQMQREGVTPNKYTFISLLKVCGSLSDLKQGRQIHAQIVRHGCEASLFVSTALLDMYARCGSMVDAQVVFEAMLRRDVVAWNAMLAGYAQQGQGAKALVLFAKMQDVGVPPDQQTFVSVLKACGVLADLEGQTLVEGKSCKVVCLAKVKEIHADVVAAGHEVDEFVASTLIHVYTSCGSNIDAQLVFDAFFDPQVVAWTALIAGYAHDDQGELALQLFAQMQEEGVTPNGKTFVSVLNACSSLGGGEEGTCLNGRFIKPRALRKGQVLHAEALRMQHDYDVFVANTLIDMYCKCGSTLDARLVFDKLFNRDVVSWNTMITGYALQNEGEMALKLYVKMHDESVNPNGRTYVSVIKACGNLAGMEKCSSVMSLKSSSLARIRAIHSDASRTNHASDMFVAMALIQVYSVCGSTADAQCLLENASPVYELGLWTAIISAFVQQDEPKKALHIFSQMQHMGGKPSEVMLLSILKACGKTGALDTCRQIQQVHMKGSQWSPRVANTLVHVYGKCGSMHDARHAFDSARQQDVVSWSALIAGYARQGECEMSLKCFDEMQQAGIKPNGVTFLSLLAACSHAGLVDRGLQYFQSMKDHGITPRIEHFITMVDLLGRAGLLSMVERLLLEMPIQPDYRVWLSLLGACRKHANVEVGRRAFNCARNIDPTHGAAYVLMSSIYVHAQMVEEDMEIEDLRVRAGAWKKEAQCWIEHDMELHTFVVNNSNHQQSLQVCGMVRELHLHLCTAVPSTISCKSFDRSAEEK